ncbi:dipeptide/oligopeptide/nickel ABC transporter permease/ATP-binding protein [Breznakiellaceae bacterium SP9]
MKRFLIFLKSRPLGLVSLILLILLYLIMVFAEFFAPYPAGFSYADKSFHPPNARIAAGGLQAQEWRIINSVSYSYVPVRALYSKVQWFAHGQPYLLFGLIPADLHLFTTEPGAYPLFLMGADNLGRDIYSRIIYGSRISLTIGFIATAIALLLSVLLGGVAGYFGGLTDWAVMRFAEFFMLIPGLYLILFLRSLLSSSMDSGQAYMMITVILALVGWPGSARTIRGMVHAIKREEFILNAQLEMIKTPVIIFSHIIPQIASLLIVSVALSIPGFIMTETTLSYLGLGITDPAVSWGSLINKDISTLSNLRNYPWLLNPVWFLLGVTLAFNFLGDCLRDFYDPYHIVFKKRGVPAFIKRLFARKSPSTTLAQKDPENDANTEHIIEESSIETPELTVEAEIKPKALLFVENLAVSFTVLQGRRSLSVQAVRGVSFSLNRGEILGIVGESGSGKSVTTTVIPGLLPGNAQVTGACWYDGVELIGMQDKTLRQYRGKKIGMIFQEPGRSYDPLQNMGSVFWETYRNSAPKISRDDALDKAAALLTELGLPNSSERLSNFPHQFSGGQLQRIGIALALAQGCELLIADEPTTALDVTVQKQIIELLKQLRQERAISIIFISHDIDLVADISDRIMVMYGGLVMESGPSRLFTSDATSDGETQDLPLHPYTKALLAASPRFGSHYSTERLAAIPGKVSSPSSPEPGCPFAPRCAVARAECTKSIPPLISLGGSDGRTKRCLL